VSDVDLNEIEEMTCVIFDQSYEHEGRPFMEGDKIFIRSELVFKDKKLVTTARSHRCSARLVT
jgi:hypothetical protein